MKVADAKSAAQHQTGRCYLHGQFGFIALSDQIIGYACDIQEQQTADAEGHGWLRNVARADHGITFAESENHGDRDDDGGHERYAAKPWHAACVYLAGVRNVE